MVAPGNEWLLMSFLLLSPMQRFLIKRQLHPDEQGFYIRRFLSLICARVKQVVVAPGNEWLLTGSLLLSPMQRFLIKH